MAEAKPYNFKKILCAAAGLAVLLVFCLLPPFAPLEPQGMRILGCVLCAIAFWAGGVFPDWVTALGLIVCWHVLARIPFKEAIGGFTSESLWMVICACGLAEAVDRTGLFRRIAWSIIRRFSPTFRGLCLSLFAVGLVFGPLIPSATAKAVLGASLACSLADALGYGKNSDGRCGLFVASYVGFAVTSLAFASGSIYSYTLRGILPADVNASVSWGRWLLSSLPWLAVTMVLCYLGIDKLYGKGAASTLDAAHIQGEIAALGPVTRREKLAGLLLGACVVLWIFERSIGISATVTAMAGFAICFASGLLKPEDLKTAVPWGLFLFLGAILNLGNLFSVYGVNGLLQSLMAPVFGSLHSPAVCVLAVCVLTMLLRFLIVSQTATIVILMAVLLPIAPQTGVSPFILGFAVIAAEQEWFAVYQNAVFEPARACLHGTLDHGPTTKASFVYAAATILGCLISIPYWHILGYL